MIDDGKLLSTDIKEEFTKDDRGQKVKRTVKTLRYQIQTKGGIIIRTVRKSRLRFDFVILLMKFPFLGQLVLKLKIRHENVFLDLQFFGTFTL